MDHELTTFSENTVSEVKNELSTLGWRQFDHQDWIKVCCWPSFLSPAVSECLGRMQEQNRDTRGSSRIFSLYAATFTANRKKLLTKLQVMHVCAPESDKILNTSCYTKTARKSIINHLPARVISAAVVVVFLQRHCGEVESVPEDRDRWGQLVSGVCSLGNTVCGFLCPG